jgi:hypothetical protein
MGWCLYDSSGNLQSCVEAKMDKIFILLAGRDQALKHERETEQQFNLRKDRYDFNFECVKNIADVINTLNPKSSLVEVKKSKMPMLKTCLEYGGVDNFVVMWGDHGGGSPDRNGIVSGVTGLFADGDNKDWIYVHAYDEANETGFLRSGNPEMRYTNESVIDIKIKLQGVKKLINYGCHGNLEHNRKRFRAALGKDNYYLGKYEGKGTDKEITLDIIIDLFTIVKGHVVNLEGLKEEFLRILKEMENRREGGAYYIGGDDASKVLLDKIKKFREVLGG